MISAWQIYLVMQLDNITSAATIIGTIVGGTGAATILLGYMVEEISLVKASKKMLWVSLPLISLATLLPNSRTAAAMIVVPALTSKEVVEPVAGEAKELYDLAKEALKNMAKKEERFEVVFRDGSSLKDEGIRQIPA